MSEITIHTGLQGEKNSITISWFDENNNKIITNVELNIMNKDKPRALEVIVNGVKLAEINSKDSSL